jgi:hypothetical protein
LKQAVILEKLANSVFAARSRVFDYNALFCKTLCLGGLVVHALSGLGVRGIHAGGRIIEPEKQVAENVIGTGKASLTELSTANPKDLFALRKDAVAR